MTLGLVVQVVVSGVAAGAAYGLLAVGATLAYRLTGVVHLAHGDLAGASVFTALFVAAGTAPVAVSALGAPRLVAALAAAVVAAAVAGVAVYFSAARPFLRRRSPVGWAGALVAVAFTVQGVAAAVFPRQASVFPEWLPLAGRAPVHMLGAVIPVRALVMVSGGFAIAVALEWWLARSDTGLALRAVVEDRTGASLCGVRVDRMVAGAFALAAMLAAVAGLAVAPAAAVEPRTGVLLGLKGLAAASLGGWSSTRTVFAAALSLGVLEAAVVSLHVPGVPSLRLGAAWRDIVPLTIALVALGWRAPALARDVVE